jgi:RNA polymerase sigma factor, sigma-70 family
LNSVLLLDNQYFLHIFVSLRTITNLLTKKTQQEMTSLEFNYNLTSLQSYLEVFAMQLTGNEDDAKDLLQETFLKALVYKDKYVNHNNFKAWVYTIMKNIFINNYRRNKKARTIIDHTDNLYYLNIGTDQHESNPESMLFAKELEKGINQLDSDFRRAFDMYNDGYKYKEIADELDLTIGTVKSRIFYSRKKLMERMKEFQPN